MKLDVPYYESESDTDCGPLALKMALEFFGQRRSFDEIAKEEKQLPTGMVWSVGIAIAAKKFGLRTQFFSSENFDLENPGIDFYETYADDDSKKILSELIAEARELGVELKEKDLSIEELLTYVSKDSLPIVLVNWYVLGGVEGFSGHFLLVTGFDEEFVYVHNPGIASPQAHLPIKKDLFVKAWESKGTDKDTIVLFRGN